MNKYKLLLTLVICVYSLQSKLNIYDFFPKDLNAKTYKGYAHLEECKTYTLLKRFQNSLEGNYIAILWSLYFTNRSYKKFVKEKLREINRISNGFTIAYNFRIFDIPQILKSLGIQFVFTPQVGKSRRIIQGVNFLPMPHVARNYSNPHSSKDILYSYMGTDKRQVRQRILMLKIDKSDVFIKSSGKFHFHKDSNERKLIEDFYKKVLSRSRFSLCPSGSHPGSIRFWESLASGAIPVVISDNILLPYTYDWSKCAIFVKEKDIENIDSIIRNIPLKKEKKLRKNALKAFKAFSGDNYIREIVYFLKNKHPLSKYCLYLKSHPIVIGFKNNRLENNALSMFI